MYIHTYIHVIHMYVYIYIYIHASVEWIPLYVDVFFLIKELFGRGQMGSALMVSLQISCFFTEGLVGYPR